MPSPRRYVDIHTTAEALGFGLTPDSHLAECPACGETGNGSARVFAEATRWKCHRCDEHGVARDLVAYDFFERPYIDLDAGERQEVNVWFDENAIPATTTTPKPHSPSKSVRTPYASEVAQLWAAACRSVFDPPTKTFLRMRKLDAEALRNLDLARPLPSEADDFSWAYRWRSGHRLLLPVYGATGDLEALRARWVHLKEPRTARGEKLGKAMPPSKWGSGAMTGCVLANPAAVKMLRAEVTEPITLVVVEGEPDYLTWAIHSPAMAVIGVFSGGWTQAIADRVPNGSTVVIRTHHDEAGNKYAAIIATTLGARVKLLRSTAREVA